METIFDLKSANVGSNFYLNKKKIAQDVNVEIGEIAYQDQTVFASGEQTVPVRGLFKDFNFTVNWKHLSSDIIEAQKPDVNDYEFRFNEDFIDKDGKHIIRNVVIQLKGEPMSMMPAETINMGERADVPTVFAGYSYYRYHDGKAVVEFDRRMGVYKINGVDYYQNIRRGL